MFKSMTLDLHQKMIKKTTQSHKQFYSVYVQLLRLQSVEEIFIVKPISLNNINNQTPYKL